MQHHRRDHEIEAAGTEGKNERVAAEMVDFSQSAQADGRPRDRLNMAIEGDDTERAADLAPPQRQRPRDVAAAAADVKNPELAGRQTGRERGDIQNDALRAATEPVGGGQLIQRPPGGFGGGTQIPNDFEARWRRPDGHEAVGTSLSGCNTLSKPENDAPVSTEKRFAEVQIVINPRAGRGDGLVLVEPLTYELIRRGYRPSVLVTEDRDHARRWAKECRQPPDCLISLAGDDTLNDLAEAVIRHRIPIISPPLGFGNVCSQAFDHRADVSAILDLLETGRCIEVDAGLRQGTDRMESFFLDVTIYGFIETIRSIAEEGIDRAQHTQRMAAYLRAAARWVSSGQPPSTMAIEVDGETVSDRTSLALVANLPAFPGNLVFTPDADPCDGLFDICVVLGTTKRALLAALCGLLLAAPSREQRLVRRRGRVVRIRPTAGKAQSSGADSGAETVTVLPRAVPVLVPRHWARTSRGASQVPNL